MPVSGLRGRVWLFYLGGIALDRVLKRYLIIELLLGVAVIAVGLLFGGSVLPALGVCMIALSAQCSVYSEKYHWAVVAFGLVSLVGLAVSGISSFFHLTSLSGYADSTSPLAVLLVLAVVILAQSFLVLPIEDRTDLAVLQRGIRRMIVYALVGFLGIVLTYLLSYVLFGSAIAAHLEGETVQDFHYLEGVLSLAMAFTGAREVFRAFWGKEPLTDGSQEENNDQAA